MGLALDDESFSAGQINGCRRPGNRLVVLPSDRTYDSADPAVLEYHVLLMKLAGIDGVIVDWFGSADYYDYATINRNTTQLFDIPAGPG